MDLLCIADTCPVILSGKCVFYEGDTLVYTGIANNDTLLTALEKIDTAIGLAGGGGGVTSAIAPITYSSGVISTLMNTNRLIGRSSVGTGVMQEIIIGTGLSLAGGILSSTVNPVLNVTASLPISSTGGTTPNISISLADSTTDGYLSSIDWNTFNDKQEQLVSGVNIKTINGESLLGSGDIIITAGDAGGFKRTFLLMGA